jgi:2-polyprenyl-3-methyl-5-hydroxy-6-metoxy-1,4-benzoquinol methylase
MAVPSRQQEMAQQTVKDKDIGIRLACEAFGINQPDLLSLPSQARTLYMKNPARYIHSSTTRVHTRDGYVGLAYSDGEDVEERLLKQVLACKDVSDSSAELRAFISDWASEYHFSPQRANLLRPFGFAGQRVLELGCGCGAITRFLGEQGARVTAVEGSPRRAQIAAERCRDLSGVEIYCDNLADFQHPEKFDVATLIGVLEYARLFVPGTDPVLECLRIAASHLNDDGVLYIAIENQLGLKYFNGAGEDHTGVPYFGINDRYARDTVVTFGRKELEERLCEAGFTDIEFLFPFPDYKLPEMILSESGLSHRSLRVDHLLCRTVSRDYGKIPFFSFHESLAWQVVARNGLAGDLANSFLVRARRKPAQDRTGWLARCYSSGRLRNFATETIIHHENDKLQVTKTKLFPLQQDEAHFEQVVGTHDYIIGELLIVPLQRALINGGGISDVVDWAEPWLEFLRSRCDAAHMLPGDHIDCIPTNLVRDHEGLLHYIDAEWRATSQIPFIWVAVRGLILSILACPASPALAGVTWRQLVTAVLDRIGHGYRDQDLDTAGNLEDALRETCYGPFRDKTPFAVQISRTTLPDAANPTSRDVLDRAEAEIRRIKNTISWQMTKPFRAAYNLLRRSKG